MSAPRVLVIGAGIVGAACAHALALAGARVEIVDGAPGRGATAAGMGHIVTVADDPHLLALTARGRELWEELSAHLPRSAQWSTTGTLWVAEDGQDMEEARRQAATLEGMGFRPQILDGRALRRLEPALADDLVGALRVPDDRIIYPPVAAAWLLERAVSAGARRTFGSPAASVGDGLVRLADHRVLEAEFIVNAAGMAACSILRTPPAFTLRARKGHLLITERGSPPCQHQIVELGYHRTVHGDARCSVAFNVQPRPTGQLLVGSSRQLDDATPHVDRPLVARMLRRALRFLPGLAHASALRVWTGVRATSSTQRPLVGPLGHDPTVTMAAGLEGLGVTASLAVAELVRAHLLKQRPTLDPTPFLPPVAEA